MDWGDKFLGKAASYGLQVGQTLEKGFPTPTHTFPTDSPI